MSSTQPKLLKDYFKLQKVQPLDTTMKDFNTGTKNRSNLEGSTKRGHSETTTPSPSSKPPVKKPNIENFDFDNSDIEGQIDFFESPSPMTLIDEKHSDLIIDSLTSEPVLHVLENFIEKAVLRRTQSLENQVSYLSGCVDSLIVRIKELEEERSEDLLTINDKLDDQEQYSRRTSLRIVNNWPEDKNENTDDKVLDLVNNKLQLDLEKEDIDRSHRVGPKARNGRPRPIIVRFVSHRMKAKVYKAKGRLRFAGEDS